MAKPSLINSLTEGIFVVYNCSRLVHVGPTLKEDPMRTNRISRISFFVTFFAAVLALATMAGAQTVEQVADVKAAIASMPDTNKLDHDGLVAFMPRLIIGDSSRKGAVVDNVRGECNEDVTCLRSWVTEKVSEMNARYGKTTTAQVVEEPKLVLPPDEKIGLLVDEIRGLVSTWPEKVGNDMVNSALAISNGDVAQLERIRDLLKLRNEPAAPTFTSPTSLAEGQEARVAVNGDKVTTDVVDNVPGVDPKHLEDLVDKARKSMPEPGLDSLSSTPPRLTRDDARTFLDGQFKAMKGNWPDKVDEARFDYMNSLKWETIVVRANQAEDAAAMKLAVSQIRSDIKNPFIKAEMKKVSEADARSIVNEGRQRKLRQLVGLQKCDKADLNIPSGMFGSEYVMTMVFNVPGYTDISIRDIEGNTLASNLCEHAILTLPAYVHFADGPYVVAHYVVWATGPDGRIYHRDSPVYTIDEYRSSNFVSFSPRVGGGRQKTWEVNFPAVESIQPAQAAGTRAVSTGTAMRVGSASSVRPPSIRQWVCTLGCSE